MHWTLTVVLVAFLVACASAHDDQRYNTQEKVPLFVDNLIPDNNPSESYRYFKLAFCQPSEIKHKSQTLGEALGGSRKIYSNYDIPFRVDVTHSTLCEKKLSKDDVATFRHAIENYYHFTMYYDDIRLRGYIGEVDRQGNVFLFTTLHFKLQFNLDRIIDATVAPDPSNRVKLDPEAESTTVTFSYTAKWHETSVAFEDRPQNLPAELLQDEMEIQWYSMLNSTVLVVLVTAFVALIVMRMLRKDYHRIASLDDDEEDDETGWKRLHADVFRFPGFKSLFCSLLGVGVQLLLISLVILTLAVIGVFHPYGRGTMYAAIIVIYALTAIIAGYVSGSMYKKLGGTGWVHNVLCTTTLFVGPLFLVWAILNTVAIIYESTSALPFGTIMALFALYFLVAFPLNLAGAIAGKNYADPFDAPTRTKIAPRVIPPAPWYRTTFVHVAVAGFLPFSAIYVELYYVFISLWGHQLFTPYGILYAVYIILLLVTSSITVSLTYLQLSGENHEWWWLSVVSGGSTAFYVYLYSYYFLFVESHMSGLLQYAFYFGYMFIVCLAMFIMLGTVGFYSTLTFVREVYRRVKIE